MDKVCANSMFGAEIFLGEFEVFRGKIFAEVLNFEEFKVEGEGIVVVIFSMEIVRSLPPLSIIVPKKKLHIPRVRNHTLRCPWRKHRGFHDCSQVCQGGRRCAHVSVMYDNMSHNRPIVQLGSMMTCQTLFMCFASGI